MKAAVIPIGDAPSRNDPELELWRNVLWIAIRDRQGQFGKNLQRDAQAWLNSDRKEVGSFRWVCDILNLDPQAVRRIPSNMCRLFHVLLLALTESSDFGPHFVPPWMLG